VPAGPAAQAQSDVFQELAVVAQRQVPACAVVSTAERAQLQRWIRSRTSAHRLVVRSRIVMLAANGLSVAAIARRLQVSPTTVQLWCTRFHRDGLTALEREAPGRGRPRGMSHKAVVAVLEAMAGREPTDLPWTVRRLAALANVSAATVSRVWKRYQLDSEASADSAKAALRQVILETVGRP
jgi:transposase